MSKNHGNKLYQFAFTGNDVTAVREIKGGRIEQESIDPGESYMRSGNDVIKIELEHGRQETTTYSDPDGDGYYAKSGKGSGSALIPAGTRLETNEQYPHSDGTDADDQHSFIQDSIEGQAGIGLSVKSGTHDQMRDQFKFLLGNGEFADGDLVDANELVSACYELGRRGWKLDRQDNNETTTVQEVNGEAFIIRTELERDGSYEFSVYNDLDGDGIWLEVLEGEAVASHVTSGAIDLVGLVSSNLVNPSLLGI
jgi:hypothetical protein